MDTLPSFHHCQASEFDVSKIASKPDGKVNGTLKDQLEVLTMGVFSIRSEFSKFAPSVYLPLVASINFVSGIFQITYSTKSIR